MEISKILKNCPIGMKLYSSIYGEVEFICVNKYSDKYPIKCKDKNGFEESLTSDGKVFCDYSDAECTLFPSKDQRDWEMFRIPFKAGDIVMTEDRTTPFIFKEYVDNIYAHCYCGIDVDNVFKIEAPTDVYWTSERIIPASEEAKKKLFDKMEEAGYKWNIKTLKLEKIEPKFKEGDVLIKNNTLFLSTGVVINDALQSYCLLADGTFLSCGLSLYSVELASAEDKNKLFSAITKGGYKYDKEQHKLIKHGFKPFDKVLVRDSANEEWLPSIFLFSEDEVKKKYPYVCINGRYGHCIPYEGNEYLLGKTN